MISFLHLGVPTAIAAPQNAWCWPISAQLEVPVQRGELGRRVALFVEERSQCGPEGIPARTGEIPEGLEGRALVEWVLDDVAHVTGRPRYGLWSRGDAWLVAPPDGAAVLDTWVRVDAEAAPTVSAALESLSPQVRDAMGIVWSFDPGTGLRVEKGASVEDPGRVVSLSNGVTMEGPLLEVLQALTAPHESSPVGWFVAQGRSVSPWSDVAAPAPGARRLVSHEVPVGWAVVRDPRTGEVRMTSRPPRDWLPADDLVHVGADGVRSWTEDRGPVEGPPPPSPEEAPPRYPFALGPSERTGRP